MHYQRDMIKEHNSTGLIYETDKVRVHNEPVDWMDLGSAAAAIILHHVRLQRLLLPECVGATHFAGVRLMSVAASALILLPRLILLPPLFPSWSCYWSADFIDMLHHVRLRRLLLP